MLSIPAFRKLALSFPGATEQPHFDRTSFRAGKIFVTLDEKNGLACIMLSPEEQSLFCLYDQTVMYPVPNKWGLQGATYVTLKKVPKDMCRDALTQAYQRAIEKKKK